VIALEGVAARSAPLALSPVTLAWGAGVHVVVGSREDGGPLLLALIAGRSRPRSGRVVVLGAAPTEAAVRRQVALVALESSLPEAMRTREALALAAAIRGDAPGDAAARLAALGIEGLIDRPVRSLSRAEARAVALAEAVTSKGVRVLLVEEPLVAMDPRAAIRAPEALRGRAREGCAVVVTTGSMRDASEFADELLFLRAGSVVGRTAFTSALVGTWLDGAHLHLIVQSAADAQALIAKLPEDGDVEAVERDDVCVRLRGSDAAALARAAGQAALDAEVDIVELRFEPPPLRAPRAAGNVAAGARGAP
jgi:ABC-type multidrug transport system ATPase subunit